MEQVHEAARLRNVIHVTAKMAVGLTRWGADKEAVAFCVAQYNRILARLKELNPQFAPFFQAIPADSSANVAAIACRLLAGYFDSSSRAYSHHWDRWARHQRRAFRRMYRMGYAR
ncbi:MAG TPA: hypothetical protein VI756_21210 [Blastocatellia bacterium]